MSRIDPTPGRVLWYTPGADDGIAKSGDHLAAIVAAVNADGTVNLAVFDANGALQQRPNVTIVQPDDANVPTAGYAEWMPYQLGQAAKTEAVVAAKKAAPVAETAEAK